MQENIKHINEYKNEQTLVATFPCSRGHPCPGFLGRGGSPTPPPTLDQGSGASCKEMLLPILFHPLYNYIYTYIHLYMLLNEKKYVSIHLITFLHIYIYIY